MVLFSLFNVQLSSFKAVLNNFRTAKDRKPGRSLFIWHDASKTPLSFVDFVFSQRKISDLYNHRKIYGYLAS